MKKIRAFLAVLLAGLLLISAVGCGGKSSDSGKKSRKSEKKESVEEETDEEDTDEDEEDSDTSDAGKKKEDEEMDAAPVETSPAADPTLAEKLCGRYSCKVSDEEYEILNILTFGGNLYGFGGAAMADEGSDELGVYSFWALEFVPDDPADLASTTAQECEVYELAFSVMSNLGRYFSAPEAVTLRLDDNGIWYGGSAASEGAPAAERFYERDERVENCLPYWNDDSVPTDTRMPEILGLWRQQGSDNPVYLEFQDHMNFMIYQKSPAAEVMFGGGSYEYQAGNILSGTYSLLQTGGMPYMLEGETVADDKTLTLWTEGHYNQSDWPFDGSDKLTFERITPEEIPVITYAQVSAAGYNEDYVSPMMEMEAVDGASASFYGVWIGAYKKEDEAAAALEKLEDAGFEAIVAYSPDWENLNPQPYFCVSAGRCDNQAEADDLLAAVKKAGFKDAYVKETGGRLSHRVTYILYSLDKVDADDYEVTLRSAQIEDPVGYEYYWTLTVDERTVFDETCDMSTFGGYEKGDTPLSWFRKNLDLAKSDPDAYMSNGPALSGTFTVSVTGGHIDRFYSCGWWD